MTISYNWLQSFFKEKLPAPEQAAELLTMHSFEVESFAKKGDDTIFEIAILPNRAHDCLSHRGVAKELSAILNYRSDYLGVSPLSHINAMGDTPKLRFVENLGVELPRTFGSSTPKLGQKSDLLIKIEDEKLCRRYIGRMIENVKVGPSPDWLRGRLESIGQKSINNIVDVTNYVMFHLGQPMHAFDAGKLASNDSTEIIVRKAREGERITTLDKKEITLASDTLVIADCESVLAIAGIKGGTKAEVDESTKNIILEAANFEPSNIRRTAQKIGIRTDSSKRFEHGIAPEFAREAMELATELIIEIAGGKEMYVGDMIDRYPRPGAPYKVGVSLEEINSLLGLLLREEEIASIFDRIGFQYEILDPIKKALLLAPMFNDAPYKHGASVVYDASCAFDCSSFTAYLYAQSGVAIPRMSVDQYVFGKEVSIEEMAPGDLIFSNGHHGEQHTKSVEFAIGTLVPEGIDHCGLYLGEDKVIHASGSGKVMTELLKKSKAFEHIVGVRRMYEGGKRFVVTAPRERLDIRIAHDLIEEIGRIHGYGDIPETVPSIPPKNEIEPSIFYQNAIREILEDEGFSEVYTYTFVGKHGAQKQLELENPLAADKAFLRGTLATEFFEKFETNAYYADLLGIDTVKIFEIGSVFSAEGGDSYTEKEVLGIGVKLVKKNKKAMPAEDVMKATLEKLFLAFCINEQLMQAEAIKINKESMSAFIELPLEKLFASVNRNTVKKLFDEQRIFSPSPDVSYLPLSKYPFMVRDIALFVSESIEVAEVESVIREAAGKLLARLALFDVFEKDGKKSFAFRLVFQSHEKTLSDEEVNDIMKIIYQATATYGWDVR